MPDFKREHHRLIASMLRSMNAKFLLDAKCYFGGGTQIALQLGEYRESHDIDFLCADRSGFRLIRETVTQDSLGRILRRKLPLVRDVRADHYGVRTFLETPAGAPLKFEIIFEGRLSLSGVLDARLGVPVLDTIHAVAEKLLANADRGMDESTRSRDLIDLGFLATHHSRTMLDSGWKLAHEAYGTAIDKYLQMTVTKFTKDRRYAAACMKSWGIEDSKTLRRGLAILRSLLV